MDIRRQFLSFGIIQFDVSSYFITHRKGRQVFTYQRMTVLKRRICGSREEPCQTNFDGEGEIFFTAESRSERAVWVGT